jgi:hypothetical protein
MLRTVGEKMKPLRGFGLVVIHFSIDMNSLRDADNLLHRFLPTCRP